MLLCWERVLLGPGRPPPERSGLGVMASSSPEPHTLAPQPGAILVTLWDPLCLSFPTVKRREARRCLRLRGQTQRGSRVPLSMGAVRRENTPRPPPPRPHAIPLKPGMGGSWSRRTGTPGWTRCLLRGPGTLLGMASPHRRPPGSPGLGSSRGRCWGGLQRSCGGHRLSGLAGGRRASQGGGAVLGSGVQWGAGGSPAASPSKGLSTGEGPLDSAAHTPPPLPRLATGCVCPVLQEKVAGLPGVRTEGLGRPAEPPLLWPRREPRGLPLTLRLLVSRALDTRSVVALTSTCKGRPARKRRGLAGRRPLWEHCVLGAPQSHGAGGGLPGCPALARAEHRGQRAAP